jgi:multiple sugar transport system permease protein
VIQSSFTERNLRILFPLPAIVFIALMMVFPILYTLYLSFTNWNLTSGMEPVLLVSTATCGFSPSHVFCMHSAGRSPSLLCAVAIEVVLGVAVALILNRAFRRQELRQAAAIAATCGHAGCGRNRI